MSLLAHAGSADESLSVALLFGALWTGWAGWSRLKGRGFPSLPAWTGPGLLVAGGVLAVAAATLPRMLFPATQPGTTPPGVAESPSVTGPRPSSDARLAFARPQAGEAVRADDLEVVLDLEGGRIIEAATTRLTSDTGHVHLWLDGAIVSMTYGLVQVVDLRDVSPGKHTLRAEFVAADHAPFDPPVTTEIRFTTEEGS